MNKLEAIQKIKQIQSDQGFDDFYNYPNELKGAIAKRMWEDNHPENDTFEYGFEYGFIGGLIRAFDIRLEDLK